MFALPVPAKMYFSDASSIFSVFEYSIKRGGEVIGSAKGIKNSEKGKPCIDFLYGNDIRQGDTLNSEDEVLLVSSVTFGTYNGEKQLIRAFYS